MGRQYAPDTIPEWRATLPGGRWILSIEDISDADATGTGKYQIKTVLRTVEPMEGLPHFENFVIGTDDDPNADDFAERMKGVAGQRYKQLLTKAGIEPSGDTEADFAALLGQQVGAVITQRIEPAIGRDGQPNQYAGQVRSQADTFFRLGERETGLDAATDGGAPAPPARRTAPTPVARPVTPVRPATPPARSAIGTPRTPPQQVPRPATPVTRPTIAQAPKPKMLKCTICNSVVPKDTFAEHVEAHEKAQEAGEE